MRMGQIRSTSKTNLWEGGKSDRLFARSLSLECGTVPIRYHLRAPRWFSCVRLPLCPLPSPNTCLPAPANGKGHRKPTSGAIARSKADSNGIVARTTSSEPSATCERPARSPSMPAGREHGATMQQNVSEKKAATGNSAQEQGTLGACTCSSEGAPGALRPFPRLS